MKHKIVALILALTVASSAQTATQTPSTPQPGATQADKASCACCDKMAASAKDGEKTCQRHGMKAADGKDMASCCAGKDKEMMSCCGSKDGKSCMKGDKATASCCKDGCNKDKTAAACCGTSGKTCGKGCCSSDKKERTAKNCCGDALRG